MAYFCSACNAEIDHLNFSALQTISVSGTYSLTEDTRDITDEDTLSEREFSTRCPECDERLDVGDVIVRDADEENEENTQPPPRPNQNDNTTFIARNAINPHLNEIPKTIREITEGRRVLICPKCGEKVIQDTLGRHAGCPDCPTCGVETQQPYEEEFQF